MSGREDNDRNVKNMNSFSGDRSAIKKNKSKKGTASVRSDPTKSTHRYESMRLSAVDSGVDFTKSQLGYDKMGLSGLNDSAYFNHHNDDDDDDNKRSNYSGSHGSHSIGKFGSSGYDTDEDFNFESLKIMSNESDDDSDDDSNKGISKFVDRMMSNIGIFRYVVGGIVNNNYVQKIIILLIFIGAIMMGIVAYNADSPLAHSIDTVDDYFLKVYTVEIIMQFIYHGHRLFLDGWLVFDAVIVSVSLAMPDLAIVQSLRIFRALRLVARVKVLKNLMLAIFGVLPRMCAILLLLLLVMYIFAVMFTQLWHDLYSRGVTSTDYFSSISITFFTLFQLLTMDGWARINREIMAAEKYSWIFIIIYIWLTGFLVVNLIIAVICDAISALHDDDKAKLLGMYEEIHENDVVPDKEDGADDQSQDFFGTSSSSQMNTEEHLKCLDENIDLYKNISDRNAQSAKHLVKRLRKMAANTNQLNRNEKSKTKKNR